MSGDNVFERLVRRIDSKLVFFIDHIKIISIVLIIFLLGFSAGVVAKNSANPAKEMAINEKSNGFIQTLPINPSPDEKNSPFDWIKEDQIHVYNDKIIIDLKDAEWATFTDTNSMDPIIDYGANAIEIVPKNESYIHLGDIVSYKSDYASGTIIHRVIEINQDEEGWYCRTKGDNNPDIDPGKIRFSQIQRLVVAVIY